MILSLDNIAAHPGIATTCLGLTSDKPLVLRPLLPTDTETLAQFLRSLSTQTRTFCEYPGYDLTTARTLYDVSLIV